MAPGEEEPGNPNDGEPMMMMPQQQQPPANEETLDSMMKFVMSPSFTLPSSFSSLPMHSPKPS